MSDVAQRSGLNVRRGGCQKDRRRVRIRVKMSCSRIRNRLRRIENRFRSDEQGAGTYKRFNDSSSYSVADDDHKKINKKKKIALHKILPDRVVQTYIYAM